MHWRPGISKLTPRSLRVLKIDPSSGVVILLYFHFPITPYTYTFLLLKILLSFCVFGGMDVFRSSGTVSTSMLTCVDKALM